MYTKSSPCRRLHRESEDSLGPDTHIAIYFEGSGTLDDLVINDLSE